MIKNIRNFQIFSIMLMLFGITLVLAGFTLYTPGEQTALADEISGSYFIWGFVLSVIGFLFGFIFTVMNMAVPSSE